MSSFEAYETWRRSRRRGPGPNLAVEGRSEVQEEEEGGERLVRLMERVWS